MESNVAAVKRLEALAAKHGATTAQLSLAWLIAQNVFPIPGTKRVARLQENWGAIELSGRLTPELVQEIGDAVPEFQGGRGDDHYMGATWESRL
jgi:aryl-alcohol dehydrogenase-like predicted oxidoreductase